MALLIVLFIFIVSLVVVYFRIIKGLESSTEVLSVIASNVRVQKKVLPTALLSRKGLMLLEKEEIDISKHLFVRVCGDSMKVKNISDGDWLIISKKIDVDCFIKNESLLILKVSDKRNSHYGKLKIRVFKSIEDDDLIQTYRFNSNDSVHISAPHSRNDVIGFVVDIVNKDLARKLESHCLVH